MAALGWLLNLGFAGGDGPSITPAVQLSATIKARGTQTNTVDSHL